MTEAAGVRAARSVRRTECGSKLVRAAGLAKLLGISEQAVRNALCRGEEGKSIPWSFKLGTRRVWARREVQRWLNERAHAGRR
jgi:predicted DNA-binding transcriptional regulator AlpA